MVMIAGSPAGAGIDLLGSGAGCSVWWFPRRRGDRPPWALAKLYDLAHAELERYLNAEKRSLVLGIENLWDKYAVSSRELETERDATLKRMDGLLERLRYLR